MNIIDILSRLVSSQFLASMIATPDTWGDLRFGDGTDLPWGRAAGSHGRVFVTRRHNWDNRSVTTVHLDGIPVWRSSEKGFTPYVQSGWTNYEAERRGVLVARSERREKQERYLLAREEVASRLLAGESITLIEGQEGGVLQARDGTCVSFRGVLPLVGESEWWWSVLEVARSEGRVAEDQAEPWRMSFRLYVGDIEPRRRPRKAGWREIEAA